MHAQLLTRRCPLAFRYGAGAGGVAYIGSFSWGSDEPAYVFTAQLGPSYAKYIWEAVSARGWASRCCVLAASGTCGLDCTLQAAAALSTVLMLMSLPPMLQVSHEVGHTVSGTAGQHGRATVLLRLQWRCKC